MKKIRVTVKDRHSEWPETYEIPDDVDPKGYAAHMIEYFNKTRRTKSEPERELVNVEVLEESSDFTEHDWRKTNLITLEDGRSGMYYDAYRCSRCGITGRRYGLGSMISHDRNFRSKYHYNCSEVLKRRKG